MKLARCLVSAKLIAHRFLVSGIDLPWTTGVCISRLWRAIVKRFPRCWSRCCHNGVSCWRSPAAAASISVAFSSSLQPAIRCCAGRAVTRFHCSLQAWPDDLDPSEGAHCNRSLWTKVSSSEVLLRPRWRGLKACLGFDGTS